MIRFVSWDWKGGPQVSDLKRAIEEVSGGTVKVCPVDTGSAEYLIAIFDEDLDTAGVDRAYADWVDHGI